MIFIGLSLRSRPLEASRILTSASFQVSHLQCYFNTFNVILTPTSFPVLRPTSFLRHFRFHTYVISGFTPTSFLVSHLQCFFNTYVISGFTPKTIDSRRYVISGLTPSNNRTTSGFTPSNNITTSCKCRVEPADVGAPYFHYLLVRSNVLYRCPRNQLLGSIKRADETISRTLREIWEDIVESG